MLKRWAKKTAWVKPSCGVGKESIIQAFGCRGPTPDFERVLFRGTLKTVSIPARAIGQRSIGTLINGRDTRKGSIKDLLMKGGRIKFLFKIFCARWEEKKSEGRKEIWMGRGKRSQTHFGKHHETYKGLL